MNLFLAYLVQNFSLLISNLVDGLKKKSLLSKSVIVSRDEQPQATRLHVGVCRVSVAKH